jgi:uncharacterized lipoprotein YehR (DUF1307 family)
VELTRKLRSRNDKKVNIKYYGIMKRLYSTIMLLAMMVAVVSFTACGGDDDDEKGGGNGGSNGSDFIELTIDGKTYHKNLFGIYSQLPIGKDDLVLTGTTEDVFYDEGFSFFLGLIHSENKSKLLSSTPGNYSVKDNTIYNDTPENLCLFTIFEKNRNEYDLKSGSHRVTSVRQTDKGIQVSGTFTVTKTYDDDTVTITGKYALTVL